MASFTVDSNSCLYCTDSMRFFIESQSVKMINKELFKAKILMQNINSHNKMIKIVQNNRADILSNAKYLFPTDLHVIVSVDIGGKPCVHAVQPRGHGSIRLLHLNEVKLC